MDFDRFINRANMLLNTIDAHEAEITAAYWQCADAAQRRHMAAFVSNLIATIIDKTGVDQAEVARRIGVTPQALSGWKKHGNISADKRQRLLDFAEEVDADLPPFELKIERHKAAILGAMNCLVKVDGNSTDCDLSEEVFEWIWNAPVEIWAQVSHNPKTSLRMFRHWLAECPATRQTCPSTRQSFPEPHQSCPARHQSCPALELFYQWAPAYLVCRDEF